MTDTDRIKQELPSQEEVEGALKAIRAIHDGVFQLCGRGTYVSLACGYGQDPHLHIDHNGLHGDARNGTNLREMINELFPSPEQATRMERERLEREREELETKLKENTEALEALK